MVALVLIAQFLRNVDKKEPLLEQTSIADQAISVTENEA